MTKQAARKNKTATLTMLDENPTAVGSNSAGTATSQTNAGAGSGDNVPIPQPDVGEPADRLILRVEAAKLLDVSVPTLRRYEKSGLKPMLVDEHGVHWHSLRAVKEFASN